jgi:serine/threonine protein kinase
MGNQARADAGPVGALRAVSSRRSPAGGEGSSFRDRVKRIFVEVCDLNQNARQQRLHELCGENSRLRKEVECLLAHDCQDSIIEFDRESPDPDRTAGLSDRWIGQTVQNYKLLECAGVGGMGIVYRAEDVRLKRTVAVKFLAAGLVRDERLRKRFLREAQAAALLDDPAICAVYDIGEIEGNPFIVTAYLPGEPLDRALGRGELDTPEALDYAIQICGGLEAAHAKGVVHRDLKPSNVLLARQPDGSIQAKIIDFGLARIGGRSDLTESGQLLGTASYVCPEILKGQPVDQRADIWSLGVILYEMLSGVRPFDAEDRERVFYLICHESPPPLKAVNPDLSEEADRIVTKALERDAGRRYQDAGSLLRDLRALQTRLASRNGPPGRPRKTRVAGFLAALLSLIKSGDRCRVTVRLARAKDGTAVWARDFDVPVG